MYVASASSAGTIEIGGQTAGPITSPTNSFGLTTAYIGAANIGSWTERNYAVNLFSNDTLSSSSLGGSTLPTNAAGFQQFTDPNNGISFAMMNDSANPADNYWGAPSNSLVGATSITVPIGLSGVSEASILLSDYFGLSGSSGLSNDTVTFNLTGDGPISVNLSNGNQISAANDCGATKSPTWTGNTLNCTQFAQSISNAGGGSLTIPTTTDIAWSANYSNANAAGATIFSGTSGTVNLEDISFNLSAYAGDTLTSITITDNNDLASSSRLALSAISVDPTPEPSTVLLFVTGLGLIGFVGRRGKVRL
jgi:hypothetical protein